MPRFRSTQPPEGQAGTVVAQLVDSGALRRNPDRPPSVRTVANYRDCLLQIARRISPQGLQLRDLDPATALQYLRTRAARLTRSGYALPPQARDMYVLILIVAEQDGISTRGFARCTKHTDAVCRTGTDKPHFDGLIRREGAKRSLRWLATDAPVE